jgi:hypothetical protein
MPRTHLLYGHPLASGIAFKSFKGTLDVADRLGILSKHPKVRLEIGNDPCKWPMAPFPYFSDLLLCLVDEKGPYLLDWPVKDKFEDFRGRGPRKSRSRPDEEDPAAVQRDLLQEMYFADADVRTQRVVGRAIDFNVNCNLREMFMDDTFPTTVSDVHRADILEIYRESIGKDIPAYLVALKISRDFKISDREATALLRQGTWRRELRVDLFQPVLMDRPLRPEKIDVLTQYATWFRR